MSLRKSWELDSPTVLDDLRKALAEGKRVFLQHPKRDIKGTAPTIENYGGAWAQSGMEAKLVSIGYGGADEKVLSVTEIKGVKITTPSTFLEECRLMAKARRIVRTNDYNVEDDYRKNMSGSNAFYLRTRD